VNTQRELRLPLALGFAVLDTLFLAAWNARGSRLRGERARLPIRHPDAPVLLLPGVFEPPRFLEPLAQVIRTTGRPVHIVPALHRNRYRITESALLVRDYLAEHALQNVTIVAHSKGGLIGKQLMVWPDTGARIRSMIAITTPFAGSRFARRAPSRVLRDFSPTDATVRDLTTNVEANARILSISSALDPQIPDGSVLDGGRNVQLNTIGHFRPLADPGLHRLLCAELTREVATGTR
jgi:triacylglycerol lipase